MRAAPLGRTAAYSGGLTLLHAPGGVQGVEPITGNLLIWGLRAVLHQVRAGGIRCHAMRFRYILR
jgi:hypothetical protein